MRVRFLPAVLVILVGIALVGAALLIRKPARNFATLPSGVMVTVEGVTFGTNHLFTTDSRFKRILRDLLPGPVKKWSPQGYKSEQTTPEKEALVYLSAFDPA